MIRLHILTLESHDYGGVYEDRAYKIPSLFQPFFEKAVRDKENQRISPIFLGAERGSLRFAPKKQIKEVKMKDEKLQNNGFLPLCRAEADALGWDRPDFVRCIHHFKGT